MKIQLARLLKNDTNVFLLLKLVRAKSVTPLTKYANVSIRIIIVYCFKYIEWNVYSSPLFLVQSYDFWLDTVYTTICKVFPQAIP